MFQTLNITFFQQQKFDMIVEEVLNLFGSQNRCFASGRLLTHEFIQCYMQCSVVLPYSARQCRNAVRFSFKIQYSLNVHMKCSIVIAYSAEQLFSPV